MGEVKGRFVKFKGRLFDIFIFQTSILMKKTLHFILGLKIGQNVLATIYLVFACLKIHGTRVKKNKFLEAYIGFRYVLFILYMTGLAILIALTERFTWIAFIWGFVFFILDIGLTVILHSIRVDRENTETTETTFNTI